MLVVGGHVACGPQTRVYQAMRIHGDWRGFACSYCGLWCGKTGETSVLSQVKFGCIFGMPSADSVVPSLLLSHAQPAESGGGVLQSGKQGLGIVNLGEKNSVMSMA